MECHFCCEEKPDINLIKIYNPSCTLADEEPVCEDCESDCLTYCNHCYKCIYNEDIVYTDWQDAIPYEHSFHSDNFLYDVILAFELTFYCDHCMAELFGRKWRVIFHKLRRRFET